MNIPVCSLEVATHEGAGLPDIGIPSQTEREQAEEMLRRFAVLLGKECNPVLWGGVVEPSVTTSAMPEIVRACSLVNNPKVGDGDWKKLVFHSMKKLIQELEGVDTSFATLTTGEVSGLWSVQLGNARNSVAILWPDGDSPPKLTTTNIPIPADSAIELIYLIPENVSTGEDLENPTYKSVTIAPENGVYSIPTDRTDPFIIRSTNTTPSKTIINLSETELILTPGESANVEVTVDGFDDKVEFIIPNVAEISHKVIPIFIHSGESATIEFTATSVSKSSAHTLTITATDGIKSVSADIRIVISLKPPTTKMSLWIGNKTATVNGQSLEMPVPPTIVSGRTVVPVRFISEAFGAYVDWYGDEKRVELIFGYNKDTGKFDKIISLWIGKSEAVVESNGKVETLTLDTPPVIIDNTTMVPLRFISEALGAEVKWDGEERRIDIEL